LWDWCVLKLDTFLSQTRHFSPQTPQNVKFEVKNVEFEIKKCLVCRTPQSHGSGNHNKAVSTPAVTRPDTVTLWQLEFLSFVSRQKWPIFVSTPTVTTWHPWHFFHTVKLVKFKWKNIDQHIVFFISCARYPIGVYTLHFFLYFNNFIILILIFYLDYIKYKYTISNNINWYLY
jgi:hypothetical protein